MAGSKGSGALPRASAGTWWLGQDEPEYDPQWVVTRADYDGMFRLPWEVRSQLQPHWDQWSPVEVKRARGLRSGAYLQWFVRHKKRWEAVDEPGLVAYEEDIICVARPRPLRRGAGGGGAALPDLERAMKWAAFQRAQSRVGSYLNTDPVVRISRPVPGEYALGRAGEVIRPRWVQYPGRAGQLPEAIAREVAGDAGALVEPADPWGVPVRRGEPLERDIPVRVRSGWNILVEGTVENAGSVTVTWRGPESGSRSVSLGEGPPPVNEPRTWHAYIPASPGQYTVTAEAGGARDEVRFTVTGALDIVEILYEPATGTFYGLTDADLLELSEAARPLEQALEELVAARRDGDEYQVSEACARVQEALKSANGGRALVSGGDASDLTEVIRHAGRKYTLVPRGKVRRHWRSYRLDADLRERSVREKLLGAGGKLSARKLFARMGEKWAESSGVQVSLGDAERFAGALAQWAESFNATPARVLLEKADAAGRALYRVEADAQLLRYAAGAALEAGFNPVTGRFGLKGQAKAELALAEGRMDARGWFPDEDGWAVEVDVPARDGDRRAVELGRLRAHLALGLYGFAGASAALSADLDFSVQEGRVLLKGADDVEGLRKRDRKFRPQGAGASAFAGVRAGCEVNGALEWDNPEARPQPAARAFVPLAAVGADVHLDAGAGGEAEFAISYERGKFYLRAKASVVLGAGCGGDLAWTVHGDHIAHFMVFAYHQLLAADFDRVEFIQELAFDTLRLLLLASVWTGRQVREWYEEGEQQLREWWLDLREQLSQEQRREALSLELARRIGAARHHLPYLPPEARGHLLRVLCVGPGRRYMPERERAILAVLDPSRSRRDHREAMEHMSITGEKVEAYESAQMLFGVLEGPEAERFAGLARAQRKLAFGLPERAPVDVAVGNLTNGFVA